ncbi:hypothetical protein AB1207_09980 [Kineococcus endophyticus]|uniref:Uncharacterized protein n=1 Tax=Kineococcus endophyticus TaxID=1181883 RepID=A0ABV3P624_9ACTN
MDEDEHEFASPTGLAPEELAATLRLATSERGGGHQAAVDLLARCGGWLPVLDAAGFIAVGPPSGRDPELRPRAVVRWADAVAALEHGGALDAGWDHHRPALDDRVLRIAASLADGPAVALRALLDSLDRERTRFVLSAVEAATAAHHVEHEWRLPDGRDSGRSGFLSVPAIVPWPEVDLDTDWEQPELALWPERVAEEEAVAWAAAHPAPAVGLPLTGPVADLLSRLRAPGAMRGGGLGMWSRTPISVELRARTPAEVEAWLGGPLPELPPLVAAGQRCWCFSRGEEGDEGFEVVLCWVPAGTSIHEVVLPRSAERDATVLHVWARPGPGAAPSGAPEDRTSLMDPAGGHTTVRVRGRRVGVQRWGHAESGLGWFRRGGADHQFLRLHVPRLPPAAVELLLQGENLV